MTPDKQEEAKKAWREYDLKNHWHIYEHLSARENFKSRLLEEIEKRINFHAQSGSICSDRKILECRLFKELILTIKP